VKIHADKIETGPAYRIGVQDVQTILAAVPPDWIEGLKEVRLANSMKEGRAWAFYFRYDGLLRILLPLRHAQAILDRHLIGARRQVDRSSHTAWPSPHSYRRAPYSPTHPAFGGPASPDDLVTKDEEEVERLQFREPSPCPAFERQRGAAQELGGIRTSQQDP
jgi:hypothetical protein